MEGVPIKILGRATLIFFSHILSKNDRQDESLTSLVSDQAGHCPLTRRYFQTCVKV